MSPYMKYLLGLAAKKKMVPKTENTVPKKKVVPKEKVVPKTKSRAEIKGRARENRRREKET